MIGMFPTATIINYLDHHEGAFVAILTLALVLVTIYYALQNQRMVREMASARRQAVFPRLVLGFHRLGPDVLTVAIKNAGLGAALGIDVRMIYERLDGSDQKEVRWRWPILTPGEQVDFMPPGVDLQGNLNSIPATYRAIRLEGSCADATGRTHRVEDEYSELSEWREVLGQAHARFTQPDPEKRWADAFYEKFKKVLTSPP
jgi:hypothetical protein